MNEFNFTKSIDKKFDFLKERSLKQQKLIVIMSNSNDKNVINGIYYLNSNNCGRIFFNKSNYVLLISFLSVYKFL